MRSRASKCRHITRPHRARGLCGACYEAALKAEKPEYQARVAKRNAALYYANQAERIAYARSTYHNGTGHSRTWAANIWKKYGITVADYDRMWARQGGRCAVCGKLFTEQSRRAAVDHCHRTGKVRALLCARCNTTLGAAQDDPLTLRALADYVEAYR
jgi:hypothetical protein